VAIFDGFSILGAIGELRGEPLVWLADKVARSIRSLGSVGEVLNYYYYYYKINLLIFLIY
jgi:hypothetical protein